MARARIRVATEGTHAIADDYGDSIPNAGLVLTSLGPGTAPDWAPGGAAIGSLVPVNQVLFVDQVNAPALANQTGNLDGPFATIQQAIDHGVVHGWAELIVRIAPVLGGYAGAIAIPNSFFALVLEGWSTNHDAPLAQPEILGNIVVAGGMAGTPRVIFERISISGAGQPGTITADDPANALDLAFVDSRCTAAIGNGVTAGIALRLTRSQLYEAVNASATCDLHSDGYSWAHLVANGVIFTPANYGRNFWDTGADTFPCTLAVNGLAIGATAFITKAVPGVRVGDWAIGEAIDPAAVDYKFGWHSSSAGNHIFWLTNLSRVSTNFVEEFNILTFHAGMVAVSPP